MKKLTLLFIIVIFSLAFSIQEIQHEAAAINIEVPVRVCQGDTFIDNSTIDIFERFKRRQEENLRRRFHDVLFWFLSCQNFFLE